MKEEKRTYIFTASLAISLCFLSSSIFVNSFSIAAHHYGFWNKSKITCQGRWWVQSRLGSLIFIVICSKTPYINKHWSLLLRYAVADVLMWRDVRKTGMIFGGAFFHSRVCFYSELLATMFTALYCYMVNTEYYSVGLGVSSPSLSMETGKIDRQPLCFLLPLIIH